MLLLIRTSASFFLFLFFSSCSYRFFSFTKWKKNYVFLFLFYFFNNFKIYNLATIMLVLLNKIVHFHFLYFWNILLFEKNLINFIFSVLRVVFSSIWENYCLISKIIDYFQIIIIMIYNSKRERERKIFKISLFLICLLLL